MDNLFKFRSFFKYLGKNKLYTFIEVFGLSVSLMFVILIAIYTKQELSVDHFQENRERLYLIKGDNSFGSVYKLADRLKDHFPEIEEVCPYIAMFKKVPTTIVDEKMNADLLFTQSSFFSMLSFRMKNGDPNNVLKARNSAVISESFARKAFPGEDPLGKTIFFSDSVIVTVDAVMEDIRNSIIPYADVLLHIDNSGFWNNGLVSDKYWNYGTTPIIFKVKENADLQAKIEDVLAYMKENVWVYKNGLETKLSFVPMKDVYFSPKDQFPEDMLLRQGDKTFVLILLSVGLLILLFAIINYINLSVAQAGFRAKEMATRMLLGSARGELFARLIIESTLLTLISFGIGLLLAVAVVPFVNDLLQTSIDIAGAITVTSVLITVLVLLLIGLLTGILPASLISNTKPVDVLKGAYRQKTKMVFSKFFITFQNVITIALVTASLVMVFQINHLIKAPLGYNTTNIIDLDVMDLDNKQLATTLTEEFRKLASVKRATICEGLPYSHGNNYTTNYEGRNIQYQAFVGDTTYVNMLGLQILQNNNLASGEGFFLSQTAFKIIGIDESATSFPIHHFGGTHQPVAGVIKDIQLGNIIFETRPIILQIKKEADIDPWNIAIEVTGNPRQAYEDVKAVYERITQYEFRGVFIDQYIQKTFAQQERTSRIVILFAFIAVLLSFLGLVAMSTYFIQQRSREIAVRKVFGSTNAEVLKRLVFHFLNYVVIAFVIVTPIIWYVMRDWLNGYSYRISLSPWFFISAGIFCMLLSFITVFWQSYQAANMNPVNSVKAE